MTIKPKLVSSNNGLVVNKLRKTLSQKQIVRDVSLKLERGKTIGLLGPNGAGKTTTFYMIMGLIDCDGGEILLDDIHLTSLPMYKRAKLGIGFLPQQPSIFRGMSVEDNLLSILETQNLPKDQKQNMLEELLTEFSLTHLRRAMPHMLSGGERRRTEIARCLCSNPSIILMDEPTAGVDPIGIDDIKVLIKQLMNKNIGVLITDHNVREVLDICDYSYVMHSGEIIAEGESDIILGNKEARKFYLGESFKY
ncbi:MAG: ABC transporter ATP-binding protein [Candidatus Pelagibacterales bacterium]|nr:MAG: ABC transporter ATP-binding protein [Pelagibacterales bacterium]